jgi:hypothetical protein
MKKYILIGAMLMIAGAQAFAQPSSMDSNTVKASLELNNIQLASTAYDNQQFSISIISSDGTVSDTIAGTCSIQGDNYRAVFDSIEQVQNNFINLEVHYNGKIIVANQPVAFTRQFLKGNLDDNLFQAMNVSTLGITTSGSDKNLVFTFLPESEFEEYKITYNPANYRVSEVFMKMRVPDGTGGYASGVFTTARITLGSFVTITPGSVSFDTTPFVQFATGNVLQKQAAYSDYELVNMMGVQ